MMREARYQQDFYPRSPRGERHRETEGIKERKYFYPRSPRGERPIAVFGQAAFKQISIHAPREGSDA